MKALNNLYIKTSSMVSGFKIKTIKLKRIVIKQIKSKPFTFFLGILAVLLAMIVIGNFLRKPKVEETIEKSAKTVTVFQIGQAPTITAQAKIEKSGVVSVVAQSAGVIQKINYIEGQTVKRGNTLLRLSTNYQGGSLPSLQRQLAEKQYQFNLDNFDQQKETIEKQKELATKSDENNDNLRTLTEKSLSETRDQLSLNESILNTISDNLKNLETATNAADNQATILATKQSKANYLGLVNQLRAAVRSSEYSFNQDNPQVNISNLQKDTALRQLDLQIKSLELSRDISGLNLSIARIGESLMSPASPVSGVVERVYVRVGQVVNPGQTLFTIQGNSNQLKAMVELPGNLALKVSEYDATDFLIDDQIFKVVPTHISREAVAGRQFAATYYLPEDLHGHYLSDGQYISVKIPVGQAQSTATLPLIPIDCVHQLQDKAYVFVIKDGLAQSQEIELGDVFGSMVEIRSGLTDVAQIIRSRNVISGDKVQVE